MKPQSIDDGSEGKLERAADVALMAEAVSAHDEKKCAAIKSEELKGQCSESVVGYWARVEEEKKAPRSDSKEPL